MGCASPVPTRSASAYTVLATIILPLHIYLKSVLVMQITVCLYYTNCTWSLRARLARNHWRLQLYCIVNIITERHALYLYREQPCSTCTGSSFAVSVLGIALQYLYWAQPCCTCTGSSFAVPVLGAAFLYLYWEQPCRTWTGSSLAVPVLGTALLYLYWT
jgi:hypothetical protein